MRAAWNGSVLAESERTLERAGYRYFPRESVRMEMLRAAARTERDDACPHGVQFYDLVDGQQVSERAAWVYETPLPDYEAIRGWVGFWRDVDVRD